MVMLVVAGASFWCGIMVIFVVVNDSFGGGAAGGFYGCACGG